MSDIERFLSDTSPSPKAPQQEKPSSAVDDFMADAPAQDKGIAGHVRDTALSLAQGVVGVPEAAVGLADIPTGGAVGKFLENKDGMIGFRPKQAREYLGSLKTEASQEQLQQFQNADGIVDKAAVAIQNPSLITNTVAESLPLMGAGGVAGRGLMATTRLGEMGAKAAALASAETKAAAFAGAEAKAAVLAGAAGEGIAGAGSAAEHIRQSTDDGELTPGQSGLAALSGVGTAIFGAAGGLLAKRLGIGDVDTLFVTGGPRAVTDAARQSALSLPKRVLAGAFSEGVLEELPQSLQEQLLQNVALDKPWTEGLSDAAVMGLLTGGAMGAAAAPFHGTHASEPQDTPPPTGTQEVLPPETNRGPAGFLPAPVYTVDADGTVITTDQRNAATQAQLQAEAERADRIRRGEVLDVTPIPQAPKPSEQMGLDPAAGPLSGAAAMAVDSGATDHLARQAAIQQNETAQDSAGQLGDADAGFRDWYHQNRTSLQDELISGGIDDQSQYRSLPNELRARQSHGMAKSRGAALSDLRTLLTNGIDPNRGGGALFTAPLGRPDGHRSTGGTGDGSAYSDGPFTLIARDGIEGGIRDISQVEAIVVNSSLPDSVVSGLQKEFPAFKIGRAGDVATMLGQNEQNSAAQQQSTDPAVDLQSRMEYFDQQENLGGLDGDLTEAKAKTQARIDSLQKKDTGNSSVIDEASKDDNADKFRKIQGYVDAGSMHPDDANNLVSRAIRAGDIAGDKAVAGDYLDEAAAKHEGKPYNYASTIDRYESGAVGKMDIKAARETLKSRDAVEAKSIDQQLKDKQAAQPPADHGAKWSTMAPSERQAIADQSGVNAIARRSLPGAEWGSIAPAVQQKLAGAMQKQTEANASAIETSAHEAATSPQNDLPQPTQAQKEAGNYKKGHLSVQGLDISVENPRGSERIGVRDDGSVWRHTMSDHYGYIKRTVGADSEQVDTYIGPQPEAEHVYVVDQLHQKTGQFDEHKVMIGFPDQASAEAAYRSNFDPGWKTGPVHAMSINKFKSWLKDGDTSQPMTQHVAQNQEQHSASPVAESRANALEAPVGGVANTQDGAVPDTSQIAAGTKLFATMGDQKFEVASLKDAQEKWIAYREKTQQMGAGSKDAGAGVDIVDQAGNKVAEISYNGRVWDFSHEQGANNLLHEAPGRTYKPKVGQLDTPTQPSTTQEPPKTTQDRPSIETMSDKQLHDRISYLRGAQQVQGKSKEIDDERAALKAEIAKRAAPKTTSVESNKPAAPVTTEYTPGAPLSQTSQDAIDREFGTAVERKNALKTSVERMKRVSALSDDALNSLWGNVFPTRKNGSSLSRKDKLKAIGEKSFKLALSDDATGNIAFRDAISRAESQKQTTDLPNVYESSIVDESSTMDKSSTLVGSSKSAAVEVSKNKVFTEDAAAAARELLRKKLNGSQLNSGIDPEVLQAGITLAGYHIEKGARTFAAYSQAMIADLGENVRPYLKSWYMGVKYDPRAAGFDGMSSAAEVESSANNVAVDHEGEIKSLQQNVDAMEETRRKQIKNGNHSRDLEAKIDAANAEIEAKKKQYGITDAHTGYEARWRERADKIKEATTAEEINAIKSDELNDPERHMQSTVLGDADHALRSINERESSKKAAAATKAAYEAGEWVDSGLKSNSSGSFTGTADQAKKLSQQDPEHEYQVAGWNDSFYIEKRKKPDEAAVVNQRAESYKLALKDSPHSKAFGKFIDWWFGDSKKKETGRREQVYRLEPNGDDTEALYQALKPFSGSSAANTLDFGFKLPADIAEGLGFDKKETAATAPEHVDLEENAGVSVKEMAQIAKEFRSHIDGGSDSDVTHVFDAPAKNEIVRLNDKVKVHVSGKGWMTPAEAKAEIQTWKENAAKQGEKNANSGKVVLSLFDLSGEWSKPWEEAGYQVYRFDIQDGGTYEDEDGNEKQAGDINNLDHQYFADMFGYFEGNDVYAILAASPCTDFAVSGARHFAAKDADGRTVASIKLVKRTLALIEHFKPAVWALENPVGRIENLTGLPPWRLSFDPNHLGDTYTKKTLIWGRFNGDLPIAPVEPTEGSKMHTQYGGKSLATKNARSVTPEGFAYGFFQANNAIDNPLMAVANKYDRLDKSAIQSALDAGITPKEIDELVEDHYYQEMDDEAANEALREAVSSKKPSTPSKAVLEKDDTSAQKAPKPALNSQDIDGFIAANYSNNKMGAGRARKILETPVRNTETGEVTSRAIWVGRKLQDGGKLTTTEENKIKDMSRLQHFRATGAEQEAHERRIKAGGKKTVYNIENSGSGTSWEITKTEYDYANFIKDRAPSNTDQYGQNLNSLSERGDAWSAKLKGMSDEDLNALYEAMHLASGKNIDQLAALQQEHPDDLDAGYAKLTETQKPSRAGTKAPVSTVDGQKNLAYRASRIATLRQMNDEIRKLDPSEAWHQDNIDDAKDLDALQDSISETLFRLNKEQQAKTAAPPISEEQHVEKGKIEEVTGEVIRESIAKSALKTPFSVKTATAWITKEVDAAIAKAPTEVSGDASHATNQFITAHETVESLKSAKRRGHTLTKNEVKELASAEQELPALKSKMIEAGGHVIFDIPGDGKFRVKNTKDNLTRFKANIIKAMAYKGAGPLRETASQNGPMTTLKDMISEDDMQGAYHFSMLHGGVKFGLGKDAPIAYGMVEDVNVEGIDAFVGMSFEEGRGKENDKKLWLVIEPVTGQSIGTGAETKAKAVELAKIRIKAESAKGVKEKIDGLIQEAKAKGISSQEDRLAEWAKKENVDLGDDEPSTTSMINNRNGNSAEDNTAASIQDFGEKIGGARKDNASSPVKKGNKSVDERPTWAKRFEITQVASSTRTEEVGRWFIADTKKKDWTGQSKKVGERIGYATKEEAEAVLPIVAVGQKHRAVPTRDGKYEIWRDVSERKRVKVVNQIFDSRDDALRYMRDNATKIIETNTTFGEADLPRPTDRARIGQVRRTGDVKDSAFEDVFGFRGVEFGNWNNQADRQELLNDAYDGLLDLAEVMDIPPRAISLGGELALAFGARGQGLSGARAHYERPKAVINLTKENGAGSLAHEWFHALDHYFGRQDGKASAIWQTGEDGTRSLKASSDAGSDYASSGTRGDRSGMREEVRKVYADLIQTMVKRSEKYVDDTTKSDEFVARAKTNVEEKLKGIRDYLAKQLDPTYWKRNNKPATTEQLAEFDSIAERILAGEFLETKLEDKSDGKTPKRRGMSLAGYRQTNDALERINSIMKAVRGRQGFNAENKGTLDSLRGTMANYDQRLKMLAEAQQGTEKTRMVLTKFAMDAKELDQGRGTDYWTTPHEMAARAFQGYVEDKIAERGGKSPFLNYGPENIAIPTPWGFKRPFPHGEERKTINGVFDKLVETLQTRVTENGNNSGVALFSRGNNGNVAVDGAGNRASVSKVEANETIARVASHWADGLDGIRLLDGYDDLPASIQRYAEKKGIPRNEIKGVFHEGKVLLVRENLRDAQHVEETLFHEAYGHKGLAALFGLKHTGELNRLYMALGGSTGLNKYANKYGINLRSYVLDLRNEPEDVRNAVLVEELLAHMAQDQKPSVSRIAKEILGKIRAWFRAKGFPFLAKANDADLQYILSQSRKAVIEGKGSNAGMRFALKSPVWRSALTDEVSALQTKSAPALSWKQQITSLINKGKVKQAEIDAVGLFDWLDMQEGKVDKNAVVDFLDTNGVQVQETMLGDPKNIESEKEKKAGLERKLSAFGLSLELGMDGSYEIVDSDDELVEYDDLPDEAKSIAEQLGTLFDGEGRLADKQETKFSQYVLPGGKNYRELLLTLPSTPDTPPALSGKIEKLPNGKYLVTSHSGLRELYPTMEEAIAETERLGKYYNKPTPDASTFKSSHYDQPNILAHVRFNERTDADGKRVLFLEELQSDWAQKGRKEGFISSPAEKTRHDALRDKWLANSLTEEEGAEFDQLSESGQYNNNGVPSAPFVTSTDAWVGLALKRMISYAAENGFDRVAWTTGEQQADRYDLSKQVDKIVYVKDGDVYHIDAIQGRDEKLLTKEDVKESEIEGILGKEVAKKIIAGEGVKPTGKFPYVEAARELSGADLKVGGEGMKSFYDRIVPKVANEITKKMGGKLTSVNLTDGRKKSSVTKEDIKDAAVRFMDGDIDAEEFIAETGLSITEEELDDAIGGERDHHRFESQAELFADNVYRHEQGEIKQHPGFDITPEMRSAATAGLPLFSRTNATRDAYEKRIDELFAGAKADPEGVRVLDESDILTITGYGNMPVVIKEWHAIDEGKYHHGLTKEQWKKVPDWLENPVAVFERKSDGHLTVIAPEKIKGKAVIIALEPKALDQKGYTAAGQERHLILTVYPKDTGWLNMKAAVERGDYVPVYADQKQNSPEFYGSSGISFPGSIADLRAANKNIKTNSNLAKYRYAGNTKNSDGRPMFSRGGNQDIQDINENENPDVFSRSSIKAISAKATEELNKTFSVPGKLNWWHKTVGTMYNLAERSPAFKRVFDAAQGYIDDVSHYANDAAEAAPKLLPRLDTWRDIMKSPITGADNTAISKPIFEGTLAWARDAYGLPVKVRDLAAQAESLSVDEKAERLIESGKVPNGIVKAWRSMSQENYEKAVNERFEAQMLKPGIVWRDKELRSMFGLNDEQIGQYHEFRNSVNRSLDTMARADMLRFGGEDVKDLKDAVMDADDVHKAAIILRRHLKEMAQNDPDRAEHLLDVAHGMAERAGRVDQLQAEGYAPLSRFGKYTVDVVENGTRQYFGLFETRREANAMAAMMRKEFGIGSVSQGTLSAEEYKMFAGITPESLELFGNMLGLNSSGDEAKDKAFQDYLRLTKTNRSAMKRLIHRQGIAGYSENVPRVLAQFIYSNARQTAAGLNMGELGDAINAIPKEEGELKDAAIRLGEYVKNPQEEAQEIRGLLFAQYLGGSIASAFVNMTQPIAVSFPYLSQYGGARNAASHLGLAAKQMATKGFEYDHELKSALHLAEEDGTVSPQEVHDLMAQASGRGALRSGDGTQAGDAIAKAQNGLARMSVAWGKVFGAAEQANRRVTFIAAFRIAKENNMDNPAEFARKAVVETQFQYSKANKMVWGRGAVGGTLMTFKTYSIAYLELLHRMYTQGGPEGKKAALLALGVMMVMGGAGGLPFEEDLQDAAEGLAQMLGYNISIKQQRRELLEEAFGSDAALFIEHGITGLPGMPLDISGRLGMGNLIPGTGLLKSKTDHTRDVLELVGPVGDFAGRVFSGVGKALTGDVAGGMLEASPLAVRNAAKGIDMAASGMYKDQKGYKVLDTNPLEAGLKFVGFQPNSVARIQEANAINQQQKSFYNLTASEIRSQWAQGIFDGDPSKVQEARATIADWNEKNPDQRMIVTIPSVMHKVHEMKKTKDERIAATAPKSMRAQMRAYSAEVRSE